MNHTKPIVRKLMRDRVSSLSREEIQKQSAEVVEQIKQLPQYKQARKISLYLSTEMEISTFELLKHALEDQKQCFIPYIAKQNKPTRMLMVKLDSMRCFDEMPLNRWGIKEFVELDLAETQVARPPCGLELIIVPGVAFTRNGKRLGHGMGYYDEFLRDWNAKAPERRPFCVGLSLREQLLSDNQLPFDEGDFELDLILAAP